MNSSTHSASLFLSNLAVRRAFYFLYFLLCFSSFLNGADIFPPMVAWALNKLIYLSAVGTFLAAILLLKPKASIYGVVLLFIFAFYLLFFLSVSFVFDNASEVIKQWVTKGLFWPLCVFAFIMAVDLYSVKSLLNPFLLSGLVLLFLSVGAYFGLPLKIYVGSTGLQMNAGANASSLIMYSGVFANQNGFGAYLLSFIPVLMMAAAVSKRFLFRYFLYSCVTVSMLFVFLTVSRASILGVILFFSIFAIHFRRSMLFPIWLIGVLLIVASSVSVFGDLYEFILERFSSGSSSGRTVIWKDAFGKILDNPLYGVGDYKFNGLSAHNVYIDNMASWGLIVFVLWLSLYLVAAFFSLYYIFRVPSKNKKIVAISGASVLAILIHQIFETSINTPVHQVSVVLFLMIALVFRSALGKSWFVKLRSVVRRSLST